MYNSVHENSTYLSIHVRPGWFDLYIYLMYLAVKAETRPAKFIYSNLQVMSSLPKPDNNGISTSHSTWEFLMAGLCGILQILSYINLDHTVSAIYLGGQSWMNGLLH